MYIQKFHCPFCHSEFFNLPKKCYVCNHDIPQELVGKMAFVNTLQQSLKKFKDDGFVDEDLFEDIMSLCDKRHQILTQNLASIVQDVDKTKAEVTTDIDEPANIKESAASTIAEQTPENTTEVKSVENSQIVEEKITNLTEVAPVSVPFEVTEKVDINSEILDQEKQPLQVADKETEVSSISLSTETNSEKVDGPKVETNIQTFDPQEQDQVSEISSNIASKVGQDNKNVDIRNAETAFDPAVADQATEERVLHKKNLVRSLFGEEQKITEENITESSHTKSKMANLATVISSKADNTDSSQSKEKEIRTTIQKEQEKAQVFDHSGAPNVTINTVKSSPVKPKNEPEQPGVFARYVNHPAIKENILLFIGIFLIMAGEVFVVSNSWSGFSNNMQFLSIYALVLSSTLIFSFLGYFTAKRLDITVGGSILFFLSLLLMPLTFIAPTNLSQNLMILVVAVTALVYTIIAQKIAQFFSSAFTSIVFRYFIPLCLLHIVLPWTKISSFFWYLSCYGSALFTILGIHQVVNTHDKKEEIGTSVRLMWASVLGIAWAEFILHLHYVFAVKNYIFEIAQYTPILAILSLVFAHLDQKTTKNNQPFSTLNVLGISSIVLAITVSTGNPHMILVTTSIGTIFFTLAAAKYRRYYFFQAALLLSLVCYFFLPLAIGSYGVALRNYLISLLGYHSQQIPYALYSLCFLPYMLLLCVLSAFLQKKEPRFLSVLRIWFVMVAVGTWGLLQFGSVNLQAPTILLPIYALCYLYVIPILNIPFLYYLALGALSVWAFDLLGWLKFSPEVRMSSFLFIAIFWYICSLRKTISESLRKALIDASFLCALTIPVIGALTFSFPPETVFNNIVLASSLWLLLSVFVYQASWLWYPCYAFVWLSIFLIFYHHTPTNFSQAILRSSVAWSYGAVLITMIVQYLQSKDIGRLLLRPGTTKKDDIHQPLLALIALPIFFVVGSAIEMWQTPGTEKIYLLWLVSFLPLVIPKVLKLNISYSYLAIFPLTLSIVYTSINPNISLIGLACVGSVLFSSITILLRQQATTVFGLSGMLMVLYSLFAYYSLAIDTQAFIFVLWGLLWWGLQFVIYKYWQTQNYFLSLYSMSSIAIGYGLCNYFLVQNPFWGVIPFLILFLCSVYLFLFAIYWKTAWLMYISAIILNQALLSIYHSFYAFSFFSFVPAEAAICIIFFIVISPLRKTEAFEIVRIFDHFTIFASCSTLLYMGLWRLLFVSDHSQMVSSIPPLTYTLTSFSFGVILALFYRTLKNSALFYGILGSVWLAGIFWCDYHIFSYHNYLYMTVILSFIYAICPVAIPAMRNEKQLSSLASVFSQWGVLLSILSIAGAIHQHQEISSAFVVLSVALNLLVINFIHPQWKGAGWYYTVFIFGLSLLTANLYRLKTPNIYVEQTPIWGSVICILLCAISWRSNLWRVEFYRELARFFSWTTLLVAIVLAYLAVTPIPLNYLLILVFCMVCQAAVLAYVGQKEVFRISHYLMLSLLLGFYFLLRLRTNYLYFLSGHDELVVIILFTIIPGIAGCFLQSKPNRDVVSNFALLCLLGLFANYLYLERPAYQASSYLVLFAFILTMRDSYDQRVTVPDKEKSTTESPIILMVIAVAVFLLANAFFFEKVISKSFLAGNTALIAVCSLVYFALYQNPVALWSSLLSFTIAGYFFTTYENITLFWQPLYLLILANIALLFAIPKYSIHQGRFHIESDEVRKTVVGFAMCILYAVIFIGGYYYIAILSGQTPTTAMNMLAIFITGIVTIATSLHTMYYNRDIADLPLYAVFLLVALTAPIGHMITNVPWSSFCASSVECAILGTLFWLWASKYNNRNSYILSGVCFVIALLFNQYDIHKPLTFSTLILTSCHLFCCFATQKEPVTKRAFYHAFAVNLLLGIYFLCFYLLPKTGKPVPLVFPLLAIITSVFSLVSWQVWKVFTGNLTDEEKEFHQNSLLQSNIFFSMIAMALLVGAVFLIEKGMPKLPDHSYQTHIVLCIVSTMLLIVESLFLARKTGKEYFYYQFQALLITTFFLLRYRVSWFLFLSGYEAHALVVFAITFFQIGNTYNKEEVSSPFLYASYVLPFIALCYLPFEFETMGSSLLFLAAVHFGLIYIIKQNRLALTASLTLLNLGIYKLWHKMSIVDPQFYGIPLGITLIMFAELNRREMHEEKISNLHKLGLLLVYGSSAVQLFLQFHNPTYAIVLGCICFLGIIAGTFLKNNLYISTAALFLVLDILSYIIKFGVERGILPGMLLVLAGTIIIGGYIYTKRKQQE